MNQQFIGLLNKCLSELKLYKRVNKGHEERKQNTKDNRRKKFKKQME